MSDIPSANQKIQIEPTQYRAPVSESLAQTMGGSINYALDQVAANASAISTETTNRINADNAIKAQTTVRRRSAGSSSTISFSSSGVFLDGALIQTQSFTIPTTGGSNDWLMIQIRGEASNTTAPRQASYLDFRIATDGDYGTQDLTFMTSDRGQHFGTVVRTNAYSDPITITIRQFASSTAFSPATQRWTWEVKATWTILETDALVGP
jgi:hypothetical protein